MLHRDMQQKSHAPASMPVRLNCSVMAMRSSPASSAFSFGQLEWTNNARDAVIQASAMYETELFVRSLEVAASHLGDAGSRVVGSGGLMNYQRLA